MINLVRETEDFQEFKKDLLRIRVYQDRKSLGTAASTHVARIIRTKEKARVIFAAAAIFLNIFFMSSPVANLWVS